MVHGRLLRWDSQDARDEADCHNAVEQRARRTGQLRHLPRTRQRGNNYPPQQVFLLTPGAGNANCIEVEHGG